MRWAELFRHIEESGFSEPRSVPSGENVPPLDDTLGELLLRAKSHKKPVTTSVGTGRVFHVLPRAVGGEWFSGLIGGDHQSGVIIPFSAIEWMESEVVSQPAVAPRQTRATFHDALTDVRQRSERVSVDTLHSRHDGTLETVGVDYVDLLPAVHQGAGLCRRIPLRSVISVTVGGPSWG